MAVAPKKSNLVWSNLVHNKVRTLVGVTGIAFAVILIFMQLGFLGSANATATLIYKQMDFDLLMLSSDYVEFSRSSTFARHRLTRVLAEPEVADAVPVYVGFPFWKKEPGPPGALGKREILLIGFPPEKVVFRLPEVRAAQDRLTLADTVLFDRHSRDSFGVPDEPVLLLGHRHYWVNQTLVRIAGTFSLGSGFIADGLILTSAANYARLVGQEGSLNSVHLGLIKLKQGADPETMADALNERLGPGVHVWTRSLLESREKTFWVEETALGVIFRCGVLVAVLVGIVFVYQVISSDIGSRLKEFATLKAIGYGDRYPRLHDHPAGGAAGTVWLPARPAGGVRVVRAGGRVGRDSHRVQRRAAGGRADPLRQRAADHGGFVFGVGTAGARETEVG